MKKLGIIVCLLSMQALWVAAMTSPIRVGLLLPLQAESTQRDKNMDRFVDFYTGALMAVYEMQAKGQPVEVYTYDVGRSTHQLAQLFASDTLDGLDMIIGPVYPAQVRLMAEWTMTHHVMTLLPFASDVPELEVNPYLLQFNPSEVTEAEVLVNYLTGEGKPVRFVFVEADEMLIPSSVRELQHCVRNDGLEYTYTSIGKIMADSLSDVLVGEVENILVMNTERYANLRQVMPFIGRAAQGRLLTLMTRYSWQDEPIIVPQIFLTAFKKKEHIDSEAYEALYRQYISKERTLFRPMYDLLGRDMMAYVLESVVLWKQQHTAHLHDVLTRVFEGVQSDIHFERVNEKGGYQNSNLQVVRIQ